MSALGDSGSHPPPLLRHLRCLSEDQIERAAALWITTVADLCSLAQTPEGLSRLRELFSVPREALETILNEARSLLPAEELERIESSEPTDHPTGLLIDERVRRRLGLDSEPPSTPPSSDDDPTAPPASSHEGI